MNKLLRAAKNLVKNPYLLYPYLGSLGFLNWLPDAVYLKGCFRARMGYKLDLGNPKTFNEKLQWLKLYDRNPAYTQMVDKYAVREYIKNTIGEEYLIPLLGVWDSFDEIDFDALPEQFVLKTNHDSGTVVICKDKKTFDIEAARKKINGRINYNYYHLWREWPYKNVKSRIIAERYMQDKDSDCLNVYKIFNFSGIPTLVQTIQNDKTPDETIDYYDSQWQLLDLRQNFPNSQNPLPCPEGFDEMISLASTLSVDFAFIRTDFYSINGRVYFSEFTFYSDAGFASFHPIEWDITLGNLINLPTKNDQD